MSVQIEWVDVRKDKTTNSDWGVEVNGERVGKGFFTDKGAFAAAKKRLLAS